MTPKISALLFSVLTIPLGDLSAWKRENYSKGNANQVRVENKSMIVTVKNSASSLIFPLPEIHKIKGFAITGEFQGLPQLADKTKEGLKGFDDFPLRVGFIIPGEKRLTGLSKAFAPEWIKNLYRQLPKDQGLKEVQFFNVTQNPDKVGSSRTHPASDLLKENFVQSVTKSGAFKVEYNFPSSLDVAGVWLSIDGDDTDSQYNVIISEFHLKK